VARRLLLDRSSVLPGGQIVARGVGCPPASTVAFSIDGRALGSVPADGGGAFEARLLLPMLSLNRYVLVAVCDGIRFEAPIDLLVTSSTSRASAGRAAAAGAILLLFLLLVELLTEGRDAETPPSHIRASASDNGGT
jgi:hypothetical protein